MHCQLAAAPGCVDGPAAEVLTAWGAATSRYRVMVEDGVSTHVFQAVVPPSPTGICSRGHGNIGLASMIRGAGQGGDTVR